MSNIPYWVVCRYDVTISATQCNDWAEAKSMFTRCSAEHVDVCIVQALNDNDALKQASICFRLDKMARKINEELTAAPLVAAAS